MELQEALEALEREISYNQYLYRELLESETKRHKQDAIIGEAKRQGTAIVHWCKGQQHAFREAGDAEC